MMKFYSTNRLANGMQGRERMSSALYEDPEDYNESWKMKMYGDSRPIRQRSGSSSYCSSSTSFPSSPSADQLGSNSSYTADTIKTAQAPSMSNEDMLMSPSSSSQVLTPTNMVNSFDQLDVLNQMSLNDGHGGNAFGALDVSYQINNTCHPVPSHASHGQSQLSGLTHYIQQLTNHVEASTAVPYVPSTLNVEAIAALPSLSEPVNQHHQPHLYEIYVDDNYFPQCAYSNDQVLDACNSLQSYYAHEIDGLGSSHDSQLEAAAIMSMPLITCAETSQSASQSNDQKPDQWDYTYSSINGGGRVSADTFGRSGRVMQDFSTALSTGSAAPSSLAHHNLGAKDKLEHSVVLMGETESRRLTNPVLGAYHEAFAHNEIPNQDQGDGIVGLSAGLTTICSAAGRVYGSRASYCSTDKADHRMQQEAGTRIIRGSSGPSNMEAQYIITNKTSGLQEVQEAAQGDQNVSSGNTPQGQAHMHAERRRRRKQGHCIETLRRIVPIIPVPGKKKADKVTILESTIEYIKNLVSELEVQKENVSLRNINNQDSQGELKRSCYSEQLNSVIHSSQNISPHTNTTNCEYIHSSSSKEILPHFLLKLATSAKNGNANDPIIDITTALRNKNLHCFEFKFEFLNSTSSFGATILAVYIKDGENYTPNLDEIQEIKQWWTHIIDHLSAKWKL